MSTSCTKETNSGGAAAARPGPADPSAQRKAHASMSLRVASSHTALRPAGHGDSAEFSQLDPMIHLGPLLSRTTAAAGFRLVSRRAWRSSAFLPSRPGRLWAWAGWPRLPFFFLLVLLSFVAFLLPCFLLAGNFFPFAVFGRDLLSLLLPALAPFPTPLLPLSRSLG